MKEYVVVIVSGAIAELGAANFCAQRDLRPLLVEKFMCP